MEYETPVVHVSGLPSAEYFEEFKNIAQSFGNLKNWSVMPPRQCLVEYRTPQEAQALIAHSATNGIVIGGCKLNVSKSKSLSINNTRTSEGSNLPPNKILLCTIHNPIYMITVDTMFSVMSPFGTVQRIVIFSKAGVQALVEFENVQSATAAKTALNGRDIYAGGCTLKIDYSKTDKLNVFNNNDMSRDYTNPNLPTKTEHQMAPAVYGAHPMFPGGQFPQMGQMQFNPQMQSGPCVVLIHNIPEEYVSTERIFNFCCPVGNICKIKVLLNKPGAAMIQFENPIFAESAVNMLNKSKFDMSSEGIDLSFSRHQEIAGGPSDTLADYTGSMMNRYVGKPAQRPFTPGCILYFFNIAPDATEEEVISHFESRSAPKPSAISFIKPQGGAVAKHRSGLLEFKNQAEAMTAICLVNNSQMGKSTLKLSYSNRTSVKEQDESEEKAF
eukprot:TRINITY_DN3061_c0_g1_i1.p1 TRINITY_DN3061_c0_g1~~TRINITY_DN3061_c0_g1_i1.p1  ORF type:complete len:442 (-),score=96.38 TRINITY_DN3061_c0_g1_i1:38-1363(-)